MGRRSRPPQLERRQLLGVFNWEDREVGLEPPPAVDLPTGGRDVWTGREVALREGTRMAPRSAFLLRV